MVVLENPTPKDIVFVVEGTALCGAYLNELKQAYILPTLENFNGGPLDEKDCGSDCNYVIYGLVVFHAADVLPSNLAEAYGPITTSHKLVTALDKVQFMGGHGEAASHVGEGLATALQCLQDITSFRNPQMDMPAKKHIILICNCKPYGLPVTESVGLDGSYRGMTVEQLAALMPERGIHLSIMSPRRIPALISLFDRSGGESSSQKTYARDVRHLVLLNGFHLQERPITPKQVPDVPAIINAPISQPQPPPLPPVSTSAPPPPTSHVMTSVPQPQVSMSMPQSQPQPNVVPPPPPIQVQSPQAPVMPIVSSVPSPMQQTTMQQPQPGTMTMAPTTNTMTSNMINPTLSNLGMTPLSQQNQHPMILIRNRAPHQMPGIRQMQQNPQLNLNPNQNQPLNPGQMNQPMSQVQMTPNQQHMPTQSNQQMMTQQLLSNQQAQMNMNQQQQMNQQLTQQLQQQNPQQQPSMSQQLNMQQMGQQFQNQSQLGQQMPPQSMNPQIQGQLLNPPIPVSKIMSAPLTNQQMMQQTQGPQQPQQPTNPNIPRWPNQMSTASSVMQKIQQPPQSLVRMTSANQSQIPPPTQSIQSQQPILSTGIQPSALQQQLQQPNQQQSQSQQQSQVHSPLIAQLKTPIVAQQPPQPAPPTQGGLLTAPGQINNQKERKMIWSGTLEWHEKQKGPPDGQKVPRQVPCKVSASVVNGEPEVKGDGWPSKLIMQLIPKNIVGSLGGSFLVHDVKTVVFLLQNCDALNSLTRVMDSGYAGCVHFTGAGMQQNPCNIKVLILLYSKERQTYLGFIPNDQVGFVDRIRKVIQQQKQQQTTRQGQVFPPGGMPQQQGMIPGQQPNQVPGQQVGMVQGQQPGMVQGQQPGMVQAQPGPGMIQGQQPGMVQGQQLGIVHGQQLGMVQGQQVHGPGMVQGQQQGMVQGQPSGMVQSQQQGMVQSQQSGLIQSQSSGIVTSQHSGMLQGPQQGMMQQTGVVQAQLTPISSLAQQLGQSPGNLGQSPASALAQKLGQAQQLQQQLQQQQQQIQNQQQSGNQSQSDLNQMEAERQQNLMTIQKLQQTLQAAQQKELQFQQLHQHQPVVGPGHPTSSPNQLQVQLGQQQIQQVQRPMLTPQAMGQMRMLRSSVSQANPGLKHLLQQQPGPQNYRMQMPGGPMQQRMPGQMTMAGQMQGGPMQPNQQQVQQIPQYEDIGILDLLK